MTLLFAAALALAAQNQNPPAAQNAATTPAGQAATEPPSTEPRLLRYPAIHGDTIVFSYAGDLWVSKTTGGLARHLTSDPGLEIRPRISPDGNTVAFTGQYDGPANIYTIPIEGGEPKRLTYDSEPDLCLDWTPDGDIAYSSPAGNFINRQLRLWTVSPNGGLPKRTPIAEIAELSYFPDGKAIAYNRFPSAGFNWRHYRGGEEGKISFYNFTTNGYKELPSNREQSYYPMVAGRAVYYISDRGTGVLNLFRHDIEANREEQLTHFRDADIRTPSTDGKTIVWERNGYLTLYDIATGKMTEPQIRVLGENLHARPYMRALGSAITDVTISPSGARVAVNSRGRLFNVPAKEGDTHLLTRKGGVREREPRWSPDGKSIAYISDESGNDNIYVRPERGGAANRLTEFSAGQIEGIDWSPDSKYIDFRRHDNTLSILEVSTKKITLVTSTPLGLTSLDWSPDSKWIAFVANANPANGALWLYSVDTAKLTQVDSGFFDDREVTFDLNGKFLYLASSRVFGLRRPVVIETPEVFPESRLYVVPLAKDTPNPLTPRGEDELGAEGARSPRPPQSSNPGGPSSGPPPPPSVNIDVDGMNDRILPLTVPAGALTVLQGSTNGVFYFQNGTVFRFDLASKESTPLFAFGPLGPGPVSLNPAGTKLAYFAGGTLGIVDLKPGPPSSVGAGKVDTGGVEAVINPREEWRQMFWEAWRFERDHFYDPGMRGLDWPAIGHHYEQFLAYVNNRQDLNYVIGLMIGELGTGHAYVSGGDAGPTSPVIPTGYLGADFEPVGGRLRFARIYRGHSYDESSQGPLAEPGVVVHEGDYLLAIEGTPVTATTNPEALLQGTVGRYVTLTVNSTPTDTGARTVRVKPVASEAQLRYWDYVDANRAKVDKLSGGRIGYVHVRDTGAQGAVDLLRGYLGQVGKDALLVDERWNGGGNLPTGFVELLKRRASHGVFIRDMGFMADAQTVDGPKAMLINGYAGSGGDAFPWLFRHTNVGPLIGKRTWGGLVGYNGPDVLVDGGTVTSPEAAMYDLATGEIVAENTGISPDIDVDLRPDLYAAGEDPQLEAGVKYLLEALAKLPPKKTPPKVPTVNKAGRIGD
jgi:tricorn protease